MEPHRQAISTVQVPSVFYSDFLTLAVEVEYLKAEIAFLKAKEEKPPARRSRRQKKRKPVGAS